MKLSTFLAALPVLAGGASAFKAPRRPSLEVGPKTLTRALPVSPPRDKCRFCVVPADVEDAGPALIKAAHECNDGGTVVLSPDTTYTIRTPTDLTFLRHVDIAVLGTVKFSDDVQYWQTAAFYYPYQESTMFWRFGGEDVNIYGLGVGTIDGTGQTWWNANKMNGSTYRPVLFGTDGLKGGSISGLKMINSPKWFNLMANSKDLLITDISIDVKITNATSPAKNTDGWDIYRSDNVVIQNSVINNFDDCVSFKPNSTNVIVQNLNCTGSHGISVGSLGQYVGEFDIVENVYAYNIYMAHASTGARIKIWAGAPPNKTTSGGGDGYVRNITFDGFTNVNNERAIELTQCYFAKSPEACAENPASLVIEDIWYKNFYGTTNTDHDPTAGSLVCSSPNVCKNIHAENINITPASGMPAQWECVHMDNSLLDLNCTDVIEPW